MKPYKGVIQAFKKPEVSEVVFGLIFDDERDGKTIRTSLVVEVEHVGYVGGRNTYFVQTMNSEYRVEVGDGKAS